MRTPFLYAVVHTLHKRKLSIHAAGFYYFGPVFFFFSFLFPDEAPKRLCMSGRGAILFACTKIRTNTTVLLHYYKLLALFDIYNALAKYELFVHKHVCAHINALHRNKIYSTVFPCIVKNFIAVHVRSEFFLWWRKGKASRVDSTIRRVLADDRAVSFQFPKWGPLS